MKKGGITIYEIADKLGVDSSTVSRALNNSSRVAKSTKDKVWAAAKELGYQRNLLASNLRMNKSNTIGVVVPRISRHFLSSTIAGIEEASYVAGFNVVISQSMEDLNRERRIVNNLISNRVDGVLISVSMETTTGDHLEYFKENNIPLVFFDRCCENVTDSNKVLIDDEQAAYDAVNHLISKGCKSIAHFEGPQNLEIYKKRRMGYKRALEENKIKYRKELVLISRLMEQDGHNLTKQLIEANETIDGIFSANDVSAIGAMKYLKSIGKRIPEDICVFGFSNEPISEVIEPSLSTVDQSGFEMGKIACDLLIDNINKKGQKVDSRTIILNSTIIERESTNRKI